MKTMKMMIGLAAMLCATSVLAANWDDYTYHVVYDDNGGSGGSGWSGWTSLDMPLPPSVSCPTRTGYTFSGYYVDGAQVYYSNGNLNSAYKSVRALCAAYNPCYLKAYWQANTYTVTLNWQGGTGGTYSSRTVTYDSAMPGLGTLPTKTGYAFGGYYTGTDGTGTQYYTASGASARNWDKASNTTLYAYWVANTYTVTLNAQGGTGGTASVTATYNVAMPTATMPTKTGYAFAGYFDTDGKKYYNSNGTSAANWDKTAAATLTARWVDNLNWTELTGSTSGRTLSTGCYFIRANTTFSNTTTGGSGLSIAAKSTVCIHIPEGVTLTATGKAGSGTTGGGAGINVPFGSELVIIGGGTLNATGGSGCSGANGSSGGNAYLSVSGNYGYGGAGGAGGIGGGGAGAGIGGNGGAGGSCGSGVSGTSRNCEYNQFSGNGTTGNGGTAGSAGAGMGTVYVLNTVTVNAYCGAGGSAGGGYGSRGATANDVGSGWTYDYSCGSGGGGGGGGAGSSSCYGIGGGGGGGGGGGSGGSGGTCVTYATDRAYLNGGCGGGGFSYRNSSGTGGAYSPVTGKGLNGTTYSAGSGGSGGSAGGDGEHGALYKYSSAAVNDGGGRSASSTDGKLEVIKYCVTLDRNGGTGGSDSVTVYFGLVASVSVPTRPGYAFQGYWTSKSGGTQYFGADGSGCRNWDILGGGTLYAQWAAAGSPGNPWPAGGTTTVSTNGTGGVTVGGTGKATSVPAELVRNSVTSATIGEGVTEIGARFFKDFRKMKRIEGGAGLVRFGEKAFYRCLDLEEINIANKDFDMSSLENAVVYQMAIDKDGKFYMVPKVTVAGYTEMLCGKKDLTDAEWTELGSVGEKQMTDYGDYRFFKVALKKIGE